MLLFIISEIFFFVAFFWGYLHSALNPSVFIGGTWPPYGLIPENISLETLNAIEDPKFVEIIKKMNFVDNNMQSAIRSDANIAASEIISVYEESLASHFASYNHGDLGLDNFKAYADSSENKDSLRVPHDFKFWFLLAIEMVSAMAVATSIPGIDMDTLVALKADLVNFVVSSTTTFFILPNEASSIYNPMIVQNIGRTMLSHLSHFFRLLDAAHVDADSPVLEEIFSFFGKSYADQEFLKSLVFPNLSVDFSDYFSISWRDDAQKFKQLLPANGEEYEALMLQLEDAQTEILFTEFETIEDELYNEVNEDAEAIYLVFSELGKEFAAESGEFFQYYLEQERKADVFWNKYFSLISGAISDMNLLALTVLSDVISPRMIFSGDVSNTVPENAEHILELCRLEQKSASLVFEAKKVTKLVAEAIAERNRVWQESQLELSKASVVFARSDSSWNSLNMPLAMTVVLITSGLTLTASHVALCRKKATQNVIDMLALTLFLAVVFLFLQAFEYVNIPLSINDGVFGSTFFMATGFHGFHVLVGSIFLGVCLVRHNFYRLFTSDSHSSYEFAIWYWHFVDIVWVGLFLLMYWWAQPCFTETPYLSF
jgi:heme/copper-type cytochrome/quinol oxidase subunit 3